VEIIPTITDGKYVVIEYRLKVDGKNVDDTNDGPTPMSFIHGKGQLVPGLEKELSGMKKGESKHVVVKPEDGYGNVREDAIREVPKDKIPEDSRKAGAQIQGRTARGRVIPLTVREVKDNTVILDYNHPLAGKTLYFDVKIIDIQDSAAHTPASSP
jgi:FKBP-type peptidyl-prolyl cis-trans isomerase SlyD